MTLGKSVVPGHPKKTDKQLLTTLYLENREKHYYELEATLLHAVYYYVAVLRAAV